MCNINPERTPQVGSKRHASSFVRSLRAALIILLAVAGASLSAQPAFATTVAWQLLPGRATDVSVGANGTVWVIGNNPVPGGYGIFQYVDGAWRSVPGGGVRVAVGPAGQPWIVNNEGRVFTRNGADWTLMPGTARDIAVADDGNVFKIGTEPRPGGYGIYRYIPDFAGWTEVGGGATRIAAGRNVWVVNANQRVFRLDRTGWLALPGTARDVGASGSSAWVIGTTAVAGGYTVHHFDGVAWDHVPGGATAVAVAPSGDPWVVNSFGEIFRGSSSLGQKLCPISSASVPESASSVTPTRLEPGERIWLAPDGASKIWAGVWFTGENGPAGWSNVAGSSFPLPGARAYGLLANSGSGWTYVGASTTMVQNTTSVSQPLRLRVNDDAPGNGSGHFQVDLTFTCRT